MTLWRGILMRWSQGRRHHLQDLQSNPDQSLPWRCIVGVEKYSQEKWESGLPLQEIISQQYSLWQEQKIGDEFVRAFRQGQTLYVGAVFLDSVYVLDVSKFNLELCLKVFHSSDRQRLRVSAGLGLQMGYVMNVPIRRNPVHYVHCKLSYPSYSGIKVTEGRGKTVFQYDAPYDTYCFMSESSGEDKFVDDEIKLVWWNKMLQAEDRRDYLSEGYYSQYIKEYSLWTYSAHESQLKVILQKLPIEELLVVPGDGMGVVARNWEGPIVAGDAYYRSEKVIQETFLQTLVRGKRSKKNGAILVLSYVTSLMSEIEIKCCDNWSGPIIWVDSSDHCPLTSMTHLGRNVWGRGFVDFSIDSNEKVKIVDYHMYTENLLSLSKISYLSTPNDAVRYWMMMKPLINCVQGDYSLPIVVSSLRELCLNYKRGVQYYYAPLGIFFDDFENVRLEMDNILSYRKIYSIPSHHQYADIIRQNFHYYESEDLLLFNSIKQFDYEIVSDLAQSRISFQFVRDCIKKRLCRFISQRGNVVELHTIFGYSHLTVISEYQWDVLSQYLDEFCDGDWREKSCKPCGLMKKFRRKKQHGVEVRTPFGFLPLWYGDTIGKFENWSLWK
jgi:hypothetical protein